MQEYSDDDFMSSHHYDHEAHRTHLEEGCSEFGSDEEEVKWLRAALAAVRLHPDFDEGGPMADMIDEVLSGKKPELIKALWQIKESVSSDG